MSKLITFVVLLVILWIAFVNNKQTGTLIDHFSLSSSNDEDVGVTVPVQVGGVTFNVQDDLENHKKAGELLAYINKNNKKLIDALKVDFPNDIRTQRLVNKYNESHIFEGNPQNNKNFTSYTINKGEKVVFCLRSKLNGKFHSQNMLQYVAIHELAHIASIGVGHGVEFQVNFKWLLKEAVKENLYREEDFRRNPKEYCGLTINTQPDLSD